MASTDGTMSVVPAMLAERLGLPQVTFASELTVATARRPSAATATPRPRPSTASLPAVVSVTDQINEPRYPSFKGIMAAKKKPVEVWSLADLGVAADQVGLAAAWTKVESFAARPPREKGQIVTDDGDRRHQLAEYLTVPQVHLDRDHDRRRSHPMAEVLVLVDHVDGAVRKTTLELLTIAAASASRARSSSATASSRPRATLAEYGAAKVYAVSADVLGDYLVAPKAEVLAQLVEQAAPAAVLIASSSEGKEIAARLAVKTGSGLITDAVDVQAGDSGPVTTQSVFAGSYTVQADGHHRARRSSRSSRTRLRRRQTRPPAQDAHGRRHHLRRGQERARSPSASRARRPADPS